MKSSKEKLPSIKDETALKISEALTKTSKEQLGFRKILFKFFKENIAHVEKVDKRCSWKFEHKYQGDLTNVRLIDLTQEVIIWKVAKKEICKDCIIIINCSKDCENLLSMYFKLHQNHSKELWNGQKGKV